MAEKKPVVGILALQGDFEAHRKMLEERLGAEARLVRSADELAEVDGLILPGGESTTVGKLMDRHGLDTLIRERAADGMPIYGTCAGLILLAKQIEGSDQLRLGLMDLTVARNAFGRQVESFEADVPVPAVGEEPVRGVFIRAPYVTETAPDVEVLGRYEDKIVAVRQGNLLGSAFHPELTDDARMHAYFLHLIERARSPKSDPS
jgi:pyridoxal 5'-phosphate synthase pdxT subunit